MYTLPQILSILSEVKPKFTTKYALKELGVFGSFARGDAHDQSDIDILVDFDKRIDGFDYIRLAHELEDLFGHKIDLVSRHGVKDKYLQYVEKNLVHV